MIRIWGVLFGLTVAIVAGLFVQATFAKATEKLGGDIEARADDFKVRHFTSIAAMGEQDHE